MEGGVMRRRIGAALVALLVLAWLSGGLRSPHPAEPFDLRTWGGLPVLDGGRVKPLDTVARSSLLLLRGKQTVPDATGERVSALEWLWQLVHRRDGSSQFPVFRIDDPELVTLLGFDPDQQHHFSYAELLPKLEEIDRQYQRLDPDAGSYTRFERALMKLYRGLRLHQALGLSLQAPGMGMPLAAEIARYNELVAGGDDGSQVLRAFASRYGNLSDPLALRVIPPAGDGDETWHSVWDALLLHGGHHADSPVLAAWARTTDAGAGGDPVAFNRELRNLETELAGASGKLGFERRFNDFQPFYRGMGLYVLAFLFVCLEWARPQRGWQALAFWTLVAAFAVHSGGLVARMLIHGRPPVTNLYSSAVFIGWAATLLGLVMERVFRNGMGSSVGAAVGFCSLLVAHHLGLGGDTMESMRAVLNDNFWLTTHVITITLGYSASFIAGFVAIVFLLRGIATRGLDGRGAEGAERMVFGTLCFTLLFSFIGTVLGGIWADQSWGRFWGWDPKENGALLIVIWNALILHAFLCRLIGRRGLMVMAVSGNIVTSWSWFGTNMLGIGLHSYGFMDAAFIWLCAFWGSQLLLMAGALAVPRDYWRSQAALDTSEATP